MPQPRRRERLLRMLWIAGVLIALALMLSVIVDAASGLDLAQLRVGWLALSVLAFSVSWLGFAAAWVSLNSQGAALVQAATWTRSQLLRYLPGAIWAPMARASQVPGQASQRFATVVAEALIFLATAACIGGIAGGLAVDSRLFAAALAPGAALALVHWGGRRFSITARRAGAAMLWLLPSWLVYGLATAAGQAAVGPGPSVAAVVAAALVAWAAGFVVIFAPGGAGVREVVYGSLLAGTAPRSRIAAGAVASRLAFTGAEILVAMTLTALARRRADEDGRDGSQLSAGVGGDTDQPRKAGGDTDGLERLSE